MAFLPSSRYAQLETVDVPAPGGRKATVVKLRRLPPTQGDPYVLAAHDRLDVLAHETLRRLDRVLAHRGRKHRARRRPSWSSPDSVIGSASEVIMASGVEYKVLLDGKAVERKLYDMIDTVMVEQGIDLAAEARIELEMCADDKGTWHGTSEDYAKSWTRIRIEVRNGSSGWVPLIDGPVVERGLRCMSSEPGTSMLTLIARDDSVYLNQTAKVEVFEDKTDGDVARQLLKVGPIQEVDVDPIPDRPQDRRLQHVQCCTEIELLRQIAEPYDMHVYVKPGSQPRQSIGCLKRIDPTKKPTQPALVLVGPSATSIRFTCAIALAMPPRKPPRSSTSTGSR